MTLSPDSSSLRAMYFPEYPNAPVTACTAVTLALLPTPIL
jgi:hypothetical protein